MIKYSLVCSCKYTFDSWFYNSSEYNRLKKNNYLTCPNCHATSIEKSIMAPNVARKSNKINKSKNFESTIKKQLTKIRDYVEKNCKYVGDKFPQEARSIFYDKKSSKSIYGNATPEETAELIDEGIEVERIPWVNKNKRN